MNLLDSPWNIVGSAALVIAIAAILVGIYEMFQRTRMVIARNGDLAELKVWIHAELKEMRQEAKEDRHNLAGRVTLRMDEVSGNLMSVNARLGRVEGWLRLPEDKPRTEG